MIKKFFLMVVLLAATAVTVLFGEGLDFWNLTPDPTTVICENCTPTPTVTEASVIATEPTVLSTTEEFTSTPVDTETPAATSTPEVTATPTNTPTNTVTATPTVAPVTDLFSVQTGSPVYMTNFVHTTEGCAWQGIAGQIFGKNGLPLNDYIIRVTGTYNGSPVSYLGVTGYVANSPYGPGSYEVVFGTTALDSTGLLNLQLFNSDGIEVTNLIPIDTFSSCSKNLEILNFQEN